MTEIITIGEVLIDLTQVGKNENGVPLFAANPGGAPANVAVAASRLGAKTAFIGKVGNDGFGTYLRSVLQENHVDVSGLISSDSATTMAVVSLDARGERDFRFLRGADALLDISELNGSALANARFVHFGSVSLTEEPARSTTLEAARIARQAGVLVSYDPNYRAPLWPDEATAVEQMRSALDFADIVKLSDEELELLTGTSDPEQAYRLLKKRGARLVLITLGKEGALCGWQGKLFPVPCVDAKVVDTNGAGDTFFGAVLSRLARRGENPLDGLDAAELYDIVLFANHAAAVTCSRSGAIPAMPTLDELNAQ